MSRVEAISLAEGKDACGIYFLLRDGEVVYVGQSVSIARRVKTHRKTLVFDEVKYIEVDRTRLNDAERKFIMELKPKHNGTVRAGNRDYCEPRAKVTHKHMTGPQLQKLLDSAGLSQRGAAREIGVNERTMRKYVAGESKIPKTVELALCWVAHLRRTK